MKRDLWVVWSKKDRELTYNWTGHTYGPAAPRTTPAVIREGGTKKDGMVLAEHLEHLKGVLGTSLVEELEQRGYDITTLKFLGF